VDQRSASGFSDLMAEAAPATAARTAALIGVRVWRSPRLRCRSSSALGSCLLPGGWPPEWGAWLPWRVGWSWPRWGGAWWPDSKLDERPWLPRRRWI